MLFICVPKGWGGQVISNTWYVSRASHINYPKKKRNYLFIQTPYLLYGNLPVVIRIMKTFKLFLAIMVLIALACLSSVQGQNAIINTYSSDASTSSSTLPATTPNGQYYPTYAGQTTSQALEYLVGTVLSIKDENSMYVNFTNSNIQGIKGAMLILLPRPVSVKDLMYFQGKELSFSLLGHDILGRPICDAYFDGISIDNYLKRDEMRGYYPPRYYSPGHGYSSEYGYSTEYGYSSESGYYSSGYGYYYPGV